MKLLNSCISIACMLLLSTSCSQDEPELLNVTENLHENTF